MIFSLAKILIMDRIFNRNLTKCFENVLFYNNRKHAKTLVPSAKQVFFEYESKTLLSTTESNKVTTKP